MSEIQRRISVLGSRSSRSRYRRRPRFSLRTLLVTIAVIGLFLVCCIWLAMSSNTIHKIFANAAFVQWCVFFTYFGCLLIALAIPPFMQRYRIGSCYLVAAATTFVAISITFAIIWCLTSPSTAMATVKSDGSTSAIGPCFISPAEHPVV